MIMEGDLVAIFHSIHRVMQAEKLLKRAGAKMLLIPVPRQLSSDCGLAIRFSSRDREQVLNLLLEAGLSPTELQRREGTGFVQEMLAAKQA